MKRLKLFLSVILACAMFVVASCYGEPTTGGGNVPSGGNSASNESVSSGTSESESASESVGESSSNGSQTGGVDMKKYPLYNANYESLTYEAADYQARMSAPYWKGNVMYNELSLPIQYENGTAYASLYYTPLNVFSVMDQKLRVTYTEGTDYVVDAANKRLVIPNGSKIPTLYEKADEGINPPSGYIKDSSPDSISRYTVWNIGFGTFVYTESSYFYAKYLSVSYAYDVKELDTSVFAKYSAVNLATVRAKLTKGQPISLVTIGDSITEGCSSTGDMLHVEPNTPCYANQVKAELERVYDVKVNLTNVGKGGSMSAYPTTGEGAYNLSTAKAAVPDLCIIAYGMNDMSANVSANEYDTNIRKIISEIKSVSPNCEFILINSFPCNPKYERDSTVFGKYLKKLQAIADEDQGGHTIVIDMQQVGKYFIQTKKYCEISSSNVNHPNDFMHRVYAMNIVSTISNYR